MYGTRSTLPPFIKSYDAALRQWDETKPLRGRVESDPRPLYDLRRPSDRRSRTKTIWLDPETGIVKLRLYSTDVCQYAPDGRFGIEPYPSSLTNQFFHRCSPQEFSWGHFNFAMGPYVTTYATEKESFRDTYAWMLPERRTTWFHQKADKTWWPDDIDGLPTVTRVVADQKVTGKLLRESNYAKFRTWLTATYALSTPETHDTLRWSPRAHEVRMDGVELLELLDAGPSSWSRWFQREQKHPPLDHLMSAIRDALYESQPSGVLREEEVTHPIKASTLNSILKNNRRWGRA